MTTPATKGEWRRWAASRSERIDWMGLGVAIRAVVGEMLKGLRRAVILVYLPLEHEVDLEPLFSEHSQHTYLLTRTPPDGPLTVHPYGSALERHWYGFEQPTSDSPLAEISDIDIAFVPGLAFDQKGTRLGRGKGYFDELLGRLADKILVGVIPKELVVSELPAESHDVPMTHLATEAGVESLKSY